jgi:dTDP-4-dehydrorhamnose 3,5-epimerase
MGQFKITKTPLDGLLVLEPRVFGDDRGFFMEYYNRDSFAELGIKEPFLQDNHSRSSRGIVRGLHYQIHPSPMGKLVKCTRGKIFDVGVDIRHGSPTFGKWHGEILTGNDHMMLYLPPGFAHGFLALEDNTDVIYACTGVYTPKDERSIRWNDPAIGIKWPLEQIGQPIVNEKDTQAPLLKDAETNYRWHG